jgi:hypothetical protein
VASGSRFGRLVVPAALVVTVVGGVALAVTAGCHSHPKPIVDARRVEDAPRDAAPHDDGPRIDAPVDAPLV